MSPMRHNHKLAADIHVPQTLSLLLIDDSLVTRSIVQSLVEQQDDIVVHASVASVAHGIEYLKNNSVDIILLDLEMPGQGGLAGLPSLLEVGNGSPVMILSAVAEPHSQNVLDALALGAADTLCKPGRLHFGQYFADELVSKIRSLGNETKAVQIIPKIELERKRATKKLKPFHALAIGGSTGAIPVMLDIISALPRNFEFPVFVAQHLPGEFISFYAGQIEQKTGHKVVLAKDGMLIENGIVYLFAHDNSLIVSARNGHGVFTRRKDTVAYDYSPSVDLMFDTTANHYGADALVILLSGMGRDGEAGAARIAENDGQIILQSQETAVVWGMPGAVAALGLDVSILAPKDMCASLLRRIKK